MSKRFWIILGAVAVLIVGWLLLQNGDDQASTSSNNGQGTSHIIGNEASGVTLVEYVDYQCPFCAMFHPVVKQVIDEYEEDIAFQIRHLPLPTHQNARAAARAAEAAGEQDKFWEMTDLLFQNQQAWGESNSPRALFEQYAQQLELDLDAFNETFASSAVNNRINADAALYNDTGDPVSTPSFYLNDERLAFDIPEDVEDVNAYLLGQFRAYLDEAIGNTADAAAQEEEQE